MKLETVKPKVHGIPFITPQNAATLYDFIVKHELRDCLELGFAHGVASCYMAAAIDEIGGGSLTSVDIEGARGWQKPSIEDLLDKTGLSQYVSVHREQSGYNWFLQKKIAAQSENASKICEPLYDLCIIDGPKNWTIDSSAFFLVDKLLKPNGWIIFDDYDWSYAKADKKRGSTDGITHRELAEDELAIPHVKQIFELLVMQHPDYDNFRIQEDAGWVWAQKTATPSTVKNVSYEQVYDYKDYLSLALYSLRRKLGL